MRLFRRCAVLAALLAFGLDPLAATAAPLAKDLFGAQKLPSTAAPQSYGFYSKGCFSGGVALPMEGPHWQVMRPSRNRRWGHPAMISLIEQLSAKAARDGWPGLLIGDIAQPRGGPMVTGHASHQLGLDVDIWFQSMPAGGLSLAERESVSAHSMLKKGTLLVDEAKWTPVYEAVLRDAARFPSVERIFVHPGIKKKLCDTVGGDRSWLGKIRPFWGHDDHFHIRIGCPPGSTACKRQASIGRGDGCDKSLAWWFTDEPWRPAKGPQKPRARDVMTMAALPAQCQAVLSQPSPPSAMAATMAVETGGAVPAASADVDSILSALPDGDIPVPQLRPEHP